MGNDDRPKGRFHKFAIKIGTVASAAASLLAENAASAHEGDVLAGLLNRNDVTASVLIEADGTAKPLPPPLVLQPGHGGSKLILAGHRSHSSHKSHSSHSSHVSGSSHSSHFSSSVRPSYGSSTNRSGSSSTPSGSSSGSSNSSSGSFDPPAPTPPTLPSQASPPPAKKVEPAPAIDRRDPLLRYQLITINTDDYARKAFIKDLLVGESKLMKVGETIGDCKLIEISVEKMSVRLKPPGKAEFTVKRGTQPAK